MIPLAYGYNVPFIVGQQMSAAMRGKTSPASAAATIAGALMDQFNPLGQSGSFWQLLSPTITDPGIQQLENKTWYGGPIYPQKFDKRQPDSEVFYPSTNKFWVEMARTLNDYSGGSIGRPGVVDISPETLEHYYHFISGGLGKFVSNALDAGSDILSGREWLPEKTPILRRFYNKETTASNRRDFYEAWNVVDQATYEVKKLQKDKQPLEARRAREEHAAELRAYPVMEAVQKQLHEYREQRDHITHNAKLTEEQKKPKLDAIIERENAAIARALHKYHEALQAQDRQVPPGSPASGRTAPLPGMMRLGGPQEVVTEGLDNIRDSGYGLTRQPGEKPRSISQEDQFRQEQADRLKYWYPSGR
jgi:hypothetical protein